MNCRDKLAFCGSSRGQHDVIALDSVYSMCGTVTFVKNEQ